ncbi:MAG: DUF4342 domain-containing protein [Dethiobacteria bacterium]|jgi:hypothetical protein
MPATLEQVEMLSGKAGLSYKKAAELLEKTGGDLLQALVILEEEGRIIFTSRRKRGRIWSRILKKSKEIKIKVNRPGGTLFRVPLVLGIFGTAAFPRLASLSMLGLLLARCSLEVEWR